MVAAASLGKLVPHLEWLARHYAVSLGLVGFAVSCVMLPGALAGWSFGALADRYGAKPLAVAGLVLAAAASLAGAYANSYWMLVVLRIVEGFGYAFVVVAGTVLAAEIAPGRSALALALWSSFAPIGFALGQWAGAFAPPEAPLRSIGVAHAAVLACTALALHASIASRARLTHRARSSWTVLRHGPAQRTAIAFGATCAVLLAAVALAPLVLAHRTGLPVAQLASLTALAALPGIAGRILPGWLLHHGIMPRTQLSVAGFTAALSLLAALAAPAPLAAALVLYTVFQIAAGSMPALLSAMMPQVAPAPDQLGSLSGLCTQVINVGNLLGPPLALAMYAAAGTMVALGALVALLAAAVIAVAGLPMFRRALGEAAR